MQKLKTPKGLLYPMANACRNFKTRFHIGAVFLLFNSLVSAQSTDLVELYAEDGSIEDRYGVSVDIHGDFMAVGADLDDNDGYFSSGSVYVYEKDENGEWGNEQKITASNAVSEAQFGYSLSIYGDYLAVGAYNTDTDKGIACGLVYLYQKDENGVWGNEVILEPSDAHGFQGFGYSINLYENQLVIGASGDSETETLSGAVYLYTRDADGIWTGETKLKLSSPTAYTYFGYQVAIQDENLVVRQFVDHNYGRVYMYTKDSLGMWGQEQELFADNQIAWSQYFGKSMSFSGDYLAISSARSYYANSFTYSGPVTIYKKGQNGLWSLHQSLEPSTGYQTMHFGSSLSLFGDIMAVGASQMKQDGSLGAGTVFLYTKDENGLWTNEQIINPQETSAQDQFGFSVSVYESDLIVGAIGRHGNGFNNGSVFTSTILDTSTNTIDLTNKGNHLYQNYPNPVYGETTISFSLQEHGEAEIKILDVDGKVIQLIKRDFPKGHNLVNVKDLKGTGLFYFTLSSGNYTATKKMLVLD